MNGVVVSCRDVVDAIKDPRWLGLVVHEPGTPVIAAEARKAVHTLVLELTGSASREVGTSPRSGRGPKRGPVMKKGPGFRRQMTR